MILDYRLRCVYMHLCLQKNKRGDERPFFGLGHGPGPVMWAGSPADCDTPVPTPLQHAQMSDPLDAFLQQCELERDLRRAKKRAREAERERSALQLRLLSGIHAYAHVHAGYAAVGSRLARARGTGPEAPAV